VRPEGGTGCRGLVIAGDECDICRYRVAQERDASRRVRHRNVFTAVTSKVRSVDGNPVAWTNVEIPEALESTQAVALQHFHVTVFGDDQVDLAIAIEVAGSNCTGNKGRLEQNHG